MQEVKLCCPIMREMMENEIFKIKNEVLVMNTFVKDNNSKYINYDYDVDFCPNCGKKIEVVCE